MVETPAPSKPAPAPRAPRGSAWRVLRVGGVPVFVERSWLLIAALVVWSFYGRLEFVVGDLGSGVVLATAIVAALLFFASILAHEIGHALMSLARGIGVRSITLFALGGVTESVSESRTARDEFLIVGIGPFTSLVLGAAFGLLATAAADVRLAAVVFGYLGWANIALAVFNVVPAYPLDGGRLLRSVLWGATRRPHQATRWAARVGQALAAALVVWALWQLLGSGQGLGGLWEVLIGMFLLRGATDAHRRARMRERLDRRALRDVMGSVPPALAPDLRLDAALAQVQQRPSLLWPVGDPVSGALLLQHIDAVAAADWPHTTVAAVAVPAPDATVDVDTPLDAAVARLAGAPGSMLVVTDGGRAVGLLTPSLVADLFG